MLNELVTGDLGGGIHESISFLKKLCWHTLAAEDDIYLCRIVFCCEKHSPQKSSMSVLKDGWSMQKSPTVFPPQN